MGFNSFAFQNQIFETTIAKYCQSGFYTVPSGVINAIAQTIPAISSAIQLHPSLEGYYRYNNLAPNITLALSQSIEFQQRICETVSLFGLKATQVPAFENLPKEVKRMIQAESIIADEKSTIAKYTQKPRTRRRLIVKAQKESFRTKVSDWITIFLFLVWVHGFVTDPDFRQAIADKTELLAQYVEYLWELLQTMK